MNEYIVWSHLALCRRHRVPNCEQSFALFGALQPKKKQKGQQ